MASVKERIQADTPEYNEKSITELSGLIRELSIELDLRLNRDSATVSTRNARKTVSSGSRDVGLKEGDRVRINNKYGGLYWKTGEITKTTFTGAWLTLDDSSHSVWKRAYNLTKL